MKYRFICGLGYFKDFDNLKSAMDRLKKFRTNPPAWCPKSKVSEYSEVGKITFDGKYEKIA